MYLFFMLLHLLVGLLAIAQSTDEKRIVGVFVDEEYDFQRIEFCDNGDYYERDESRGTYEVIDGEIHCKALGLSYSHLKFQIDGECLVDEGNNRWIRSKSFVYPWKERIPYTIRFQDKVTRDLLTNLRVSYEILNQSGKYIAPTVRGFAINEDGSMVIDAPQSCEISLRLHADYIQVSNDNVRLIVRSTDPSRSKVVQVKRGQSVSGIVVHADTGQPVPDVVLSPVTFGHPMCYADATRKVISDKVGRFHLQCLDEEFGFNVKHPLFRPIFQKRFKNGEKTEGIVIELDPGDSLRGTVRNQFGQPLKDVDVSLELGSWFELNSTMTDEHGIFELHGLNLRAYPKSDLFVYEYLNAGIVGSGGKRRSMRPMDAICTIDSLDSVRCS